MCLYFLIYLERALYFNAAAVRGSEWMSQNEWEQILIELIKDEENARKEIMLHANSRSYGKTNNCFSSVIFLDHRK